MKVLLLPLMLSCVIGNPAPDPQDIHLHFHEGDGGYGKSSGLQSSPSHHNSTKKDGGKRNYPWNSRGFFQDKSKDLIKREDQKHLKDIHGFKMTDLYGPQGSRKSDVFGSQGIKRPDLYDAQGIKRPDLKGLQGIKEKNLYGSQGIKKPDLYGSKGINMPDLYGSQGIKRTDVYGSQEVKRPDLFGSKGTKRPDFYDDEHGSDYVASGCDCSDGAGLFGNIPPKCCEIAAYTFQGRARPNGIYYTIWTDAQCDNLGQGPKTSIEDCKASCLEHPSLRCTAVNWRPVPKECVMRACPRPVQNPVWLYKNYRGYVVSHSPGSPKGYPNKHSPKIFTDEQCRNIGQRSIRKPSDCWNACHVNTECNAVNFSPRDCILRACPIPIPEPSGWKKLYLSSST